VHHAAAWHIALCIMTTHFSLCCDIAHHFAAAFFIMPWHFSSCHNIGNGICTLCMVLALKLSKAIVAVLLFCSVLKNKFTAVVTLASSCAALMAVSAFLCSAIKILIKQSDGCVLEADGNWCPEAGGD